MNWLPIETAPKEGTNVLVFCRASRDPFQEDPDEIHVARYSGKDPGYWDVSGGYLSVAPTHWMPLPEPPK